MDFQGFIEFTAVKISCYILFGAILLRLFFFLFTISINAEKNTGTPLYIIKTIVRSFFPLHRISIKKPIYTSLRYIFHICIIVVPICYSGHIMIWEALETDFYPPELSDILIDRLAIIAIFLGIWFLLRRIFIKQVRQNSSWFDYLFIILITLPFISGYYLVSGTPSYIFFLDNHMWNIHIISGEIFILCAAFLFCSTRINSDKCIACASCEIACPTETLETIDNDELRTFKYSHYQCICCGSCINSCPENAVELRHNISLIKFFQVNIKNIIRTATLKRCIRCTKTYTPEPIFDKVNIQLNHDYLKLCPECRSHNHAKNFLK